MGAYITKNTSANEGAFICGKTFKVLCDVLVKENGTLFVNNYYIEPTNKYQNNTIIQVMNTYSGLNLPDVGQFDLIMGNVVINDKCIENVNLKPLFINTKNTYIHDPNYLTDMNVDFKYDDKIIPIKQQKIDMLKATIELLTLYKIPKSTFEDYNLDAMSDDDLWRLHKKMNEVYCTITNDNYNDDNLKYC